MASFLHEEGEQEEMVVLGDPIAYVKWGREVNSDEERGEEREEERRTGKHFSVI